MAHKTLLGGTAYTVAGGRELIDGVSYTKKQGKTCIDGAAYTLGFAADPAVFANNDWATIIEACQSGTVPSTWAVGDSKMMTIGDTDYQIDIIGKAHDEYVYSSGKAPLTFQMHGLYKTKYSISDATSNRNGWMKCSMRETVIPLIIEQMPAEVQAALQKVKKHSSEGADNYGRYETSDDLFILSAYEIWGVQKPNINIVEGAQYAYYKTGGAAARIKTLPGEEAGSSWWLRSIKTNTSSEFCVVDGSGNFSSVRMTEEQGLSLGFCF